MTTIISLKSSMGSQLRLVAFALFLLAFPALVQAQLTNIQYTTTSDGNGGLVITGPNTLSGAVIIPSTINGLTVTGIGDYAFNADTAMTSVTIPDSVTSIGYAAFADCGLASVTIGNSVTGIGDSAFVDCSGLTSITVSPQNSNYSSVNGVLFDKNQTTLIEYPEGASGAYTIPSSVTSIGNLAFYDCTSLTSLTISNSVTSIGNQAFEYCTDLTSVTISNSATNIGGYAFYACARLTSVTIPNSATSIGNNAFEYCTGLTNVTIPNSITGIGDSAFANCTSLASVTISSGITSIGYDMFDGCTSLASVTIPNSVTSIGDDAFAGCNGLTSVTIPNSVTSLGQEAFSGCTSLTRALFQGNAPTMGGNVLSNVANGFSVEYYDGAIGFTSPTWAPDASDSYPAVDLGPNPNPTDASPLDGASLGGDRFYTFTFGYYNEADYPWVYQNDLGFIYFDPGSGGAIYLYSSGVSLGWLYTTTSNLPNIYSFQENSWLYFYPGATTNNFYNYTTGQFETHHL